MNIRRLVLSAAAALASVPASAITPTPGSCVAAAKSLLSSQNVTLVKEYDPDFGEYDPDSGVTYFAVTLTRGKSYTVYLTGGSASEMMLDADVNDDYYDAHEELESPSASFDFYEYDDGATQVGYLYADDWDPYDPASGKYIVAVYGDVGQKSKLYFTSGIKSFDPVGSENNPLGLTIKEKWQTTGSRKLIDGEYYMRATLQAGRKYRVRTKGGTAKAPLSISVESPGEADVTITKDTSFDSTNPYDQAFIIVPSDKGSYTFIVQGQATQSFQFLYTAIPTRAITAHPYIPLVKEQGYSATFVPGRVADNYNYYDNIIDEHLCRIYLEKGARWSFETEGATKKQRMIVYGPDGKVLGKNDRKALPFDGNIDDDSRVVITASTAGFHYVGVCDLTLGVDEPGTGGEIVLTATDVSNVNDADAWDPTDNAIAGATPMVAYPAATNELAVAATTNETARRVGAVSGPHQFNSADTYDCYAVSCRKGYTYRFRASFADEDDMSDFHLAARVYSAALKKYVDDTVTGTISPVAGNQGRDEADLRFTAKADGTYYVLVSVEEGMGLDFPRYNLHAVVSFGETKLGLVQVVSEGVSAKWLLPKDTAARASGDVVTVPAGKLTVTAGNVTGFTKDAATKDVTVNEWTDGAEIQVISNRYSDIYDKPWTETVTTTTKKNGKTVKTTKNVTHPADNTIEGAIAIAPVAAEQVAYRSLRNDDPADWFSFTATDYTYYNFRLDDLAGDAKITVTNEAAGVLAEGTEILRLHIPAGKTWVVVTHGTEDELDSSYSLAYSRATVGFTTFSAAKFVAQQGSEYATLTIARSGTEGAESIRYATQAESAVPGTNYYPVTDGVVSWAVGDKAKKTIQIRLIPDLVSQWEGSNKTFRVKLYPVDEYALKDGEYLAILSTNFYPEAQVIIKETAAKQPGTIALTAYGDGTAVANTAAPVVSGTAGDGNFTLTFSRQGGADGEVAIKVASKVVKGDTASANVDYTPIAEKITWANGDDADKTVVLPLKARTGNDYTVSRKFTIAIAAYKTTGTVPKLAAAKGTVVVKNRLVEQSSATFAKTLAKGGVKLTTTGTWFVDTNGVYRSAAANGVSAFTLTGPGFFACEPELVTNGISSAKLVCQILKGKTVIEKIDCASTNFSGRIARAIAAGSNVVKFTLAGVKGEAYVRFKPQADGLPCKWIPFSKAAPVDPMNKSVLTNETVTLSWSVPQELEEELGLYCRVRAGTKSKLTLVDVVGIDLERAFRMEYPVNLVAGTTYYWAVDYYFGKAGMTPEELRAVPNASWVSGPATWSFSAMAAKATITEFTLGSVDAAGTPVADRLAADEPVELIQGVKPNLFLDGMNAAGTGANFYRYVSGTLPPGITVNSKTGELTGAPSTPGEYRVALQSCFYVDKKKNGKTTRTWLYGNTIPVRFNVLPAGTALGNFRAVLTEDAFDFADDAHHLAFLTLGVAATGKMSAKVTLGGLTYAFAATGYDEIYERDDDREGLKRKFYVTMTGSSVTAVTKNGKTTKTVYTNYLQLLVGDGEKDDFKALTADDIGQVDMTINVLNAKKTAVTPNAYYVGTLRRYIADAADDGVKADLAGFAGYYTMALAPLAVAPDAGVPAGNGYLTMTVDENGSAKFSGSLADGVSASGSSLGQLCTDPETGMRLLKIPVYSGSAGYAIAGTVVLKHEADGVAAVFEPGETLEWVRSAAAATSRSGDGFDITVAPTGGWYDKVVNLQSYYLNGEFAIQGAESGEDLPEEALTKGYSFSTESTPQNLNVKFTGNTLVPDAYKIVKNKTVGLSDFSESVNPWNVTVKFNRATGILAGTFMAWQWVYKTDGGFTYPTKQALIKNIVHRGVHLFTRDSSATSPLAENVLTAGYFLMPTTLKWKASLPFNILETDNQEKNYDEKEFDEQGE